MRIGLVKGIVAGILGAMVAMGLTMGVRILTGAAAWNPGPVTIIGTLVGIVVYLWRLGVFAAWTKWALGHEQEEDPPHDHTPRWTRYLSYNTNHKVIGVQYMVTSLVVILVAGAYQLLARIQLARPESNFLDPGTYNSLISLHGIMMLGAVLLGVAGMMNYLVPLMIGAKDMAFPRLNALSYWIVPPAILLFLFSLPTGGFDTGWTAYPPLSVQAPLGMQLMLLAFYLVGWSSILGGVNFLTTIFKMRAPGMSMFRMPIFVWATLATAILQLLFTQFVGIAFLMVLFQRLLGLSFFNPYQGGNPILFQHLFWFYSHPAVYIFVLPGLGVISEVLPVFSRKPLFGYKAVALSSIGIAAGGSIVWGHHMFVAGLENPLMIPMTVTTLLVAVPTGVKIFSWLATMWQGKIQLKTPMLFVISAIAIFLVGGLTGVPQALIPTDMHLTDTYWIMSHFHHTLFGGFVFPAMAAIYYWFPKVTGRFLSEKLGRIHWALMTVGFFTTYEVMFWLGLNGMRRRVATYEATAGFGNLNLIATIGAFIIALSMLLLVINLVMSLRRGAAAPANPWGSRTLEWQVASPPPEENFPATPQVVGHPYGYGTPGSVHVIVPPERDVSKAKA